jgi:hypothetical protein
MLPALLRPRGIGIFCDRGCICPMARLKARSAPPIPGTLGMGVTGDDAAVLLWFF